MESHLDVYVLSKARTQQAVWAFLERYVDITAAEDRGDEELMLLPLGSLSTDTETLVRGQAGANPLDSYEWIPAITLTNSIVIGLGRPWRAFTVGGLPARKPEIRFASITFTVDGGVVFGLALPDLESARHWMDRLLSETHWEVVLIGDYAPPLSDAEAATLLVSPFTLVSRRNPDAEPQVRSLHGQYQAPPD